MLRPILTQIKREDQSTYAFVFAVAKRAREIAEEMENEQELSTEKPVDIAVSEFATGKVKLGRIITIDEK
jgi:DNA-directed RNA polymerase subunit omega